MLGHSVHSSPLETDGKGSVIKPVAATLLHTAQIIRSEEMSLDFYTCITEKGQRRNGLDLFTFGIRGYTVPRRCILLITSAATQCLAAVVSW